jgi:hypothetical protein
MTFLGSLGCTHTKYVQFDIPVRPPLPQPKFLGEANAIASYLEAGKFLRCLDIENAKLFLEREETWKFYSTQLIETINGANRALAGQDE